MNEGENTNNNGNDTNNDNINNDNTGMDSKIISGRVVGILKRNWKTYCGSIEPVPEGSVVGYVGNQSSIYDSFNSH